MIGLATNVLVRYLAQDDAIQSRQATQIIERQLTEDDPGFISVVTMVETVWVLSRVYGLSDQEIAAGVEHILQADTLRVQNEQEVFSAMIALKTGAGSFADAFIGALGGWAGCSVTLTFDKKAKQLKGFQVIKGRKNASNPLVACMVGAGVKPTLRSDAGSDLQKASGPLPQSDLSVAQVSSRWQSGQ